MQAHEASFKSITDEYQKLIIPFYQRSYVWDKEDWEKLYDDLFSSMENSKDHFLGSLLIRKDSSLPTGYVVDGQQRLTTFSLLLRALFKDTLAAFRQIPLQTISASLSPLWIVSNNQAKSKLEHSHIDSNNFNNIINFKRSDEFTNIKNTSKMHNAYMFFSTELEKLSLETRQRFFDYLMERKLFVHITIQESEDEQKIFDSINTTGEPLTVTDIIKNDLFRRLLKATSVSPDAVNGYYNDYWKSIFESNKEQTEFWNTKHTIGRYQRYRSELLLQGFAICEGVLEEKDNFNDLGIRFKKKLEDFTADQLLSILKKIHSYAQDFFTWNLFLPKNEFQDFNFSASPEDRLFHYLRTSPTTTIYPTLLFIRHNLKDNPDYEKCISLIESYLVRRALLGLTDKNYNKNFLKTISTLRSIPKEEIYKTLQEEIYRFSADSDFFPNNDQLTKLRDIKIDHSIVKYTLYWIALSLDNEKSENVKLTFDKNLTVEHLMPQKWQTYWNAQLTNEQKENREKLIYTIGNLSLLSGKLNSQVQNHNWKVKIKGNGKDKGIAELSVLNLNKDSSENGLLNHTLWDEDEITIRTNKLIDIIETIWKY